MAMSLVLLSYGVYSSYLIWLKLELVMSVIVIMEIQFEWQNFFSKYTVIINYIFIYISLNSPSCA